MPPENLTPSETSTPPAEGLAPLDAAADPPIALTPGQKRHLLDASPSPRAPWYINDHTVVRDEQGTWHVFGIWHPEPAAPLDETFFLHASAPSLTPDAWSIHDPVLHARTDLGETHVWAPHVIRHEGSYLMFYCGGTADHTRYRIELATSTDLFTWEHHQGGPVFEDGFDARDPMVLRDGDRWLMYCTRTSRPGGGFHEVSVRQSRDLVTWSAPSVAYRSTQSGTVGGPTESPFVVPVTADGAIADAAPADAVPADTSPADAVPAGAAPADGAGRPEGWILFVCESGEYDRTLAYFSRDPMHFEDAGRIEVDLDEHCAEIVVDPGTSRSVWITGGGWGRGGLSIRPLRITSARPS
ncbi:glycosyl hydrolase family 32 [Brachybacterium endophyticum]|uniref:Glycosyl hydrolase family 32 n=1 Tax=Brachybacterium endophyticum TaxID=2182385 RepID=A0A2U2RNX8_9MICO|nr:glycosyl hydrolase family 32 [Brachybacterium endophyticum]PWH07464.1 glycosyl hydrolase family 32 [Brachybacterium endophyticum]